MNQLSHFEFYFLRSPRLSLNITQKINSLQHWDDIALFIKSLINNQEIKEAIFLASPELIIEIDKYLNLDKQLPKNILKAIYKYIIRMSTRCTPYGLFAGISLGKIAPIKLSSIIRTDDFKIAVRLDMQILAAIAGEISIHHTIKPYVKLYSNNTIYKQGSQYKFYQKKTITPSSCKSTLNSVSSSTILDEIVELATDGICYHELQEVLLSKGFNKNQVTTFLDKIIENQFLINEFIPNLMGEDFFYLLIRKIVLIDEKNPYTFILKKILNELTNNNSLLKKQNILTNIFTHNFPTLFSKYTIQADQLIRTKKNEISKNTVNTIVKQLQELSSLSAQEPSQLMQFKERFISRYDRRMVPLLEVLDPDTGLGYGNATDRYRNDDHLLANIKIKQNRVNIDGKSTFQKFLLNKYIADNNSEIVLSELDLQHLYEDTTKNYPSTFYAMGNLIIENNDFDNFKFCLSACGGSSAANLMSRFGYLDKELQQKLQEITTYEQSLYPNAVLAEVIHLPESRTGNILQKTNIRDAELILMANSTRDNKIIKLNDLHLFIQDNRIILWSKSLNKEIMPRITSAHNFHKGFHLYQFLGDLQFEHSHLNIKWSWGDLVTQKYLPRVRYKDIILSSAQWTLKQLSTHEYKSDPEVLIKNLVEQYQLPRQVLLSEGDNDFLITFSSPISQEIFLNKLSKKDLLLKEFIYTGFESIVCDEQQKKYANEIIIPIKSNSHVSSVMAPLENTKIKRSFSLGSEWVYIKIYCGNNYGDQIIQKEIHEIIQQLKNKHLLKKWFFIRYNDPTNHIRLRIKGHDSKQFSQIVTIIQNIIYPLLENNEISSIQFDTYNREIERYYPDCIELSEHFFYMDSNYVLNAINNYPFSQSRWLFALVGIDKIFDSAKMVLGEKHKFSEKMRIFFSSEFGNEKENNKNLNQKFRDRKQIIESAIGQQSSELDERGMCIELICKNIQYSTLNDDEKIKKKLTLLESYIHMFINRLFSSEPRLNEFVSYHLLSCYYRSQIAKQNRAI
ncbi:hypothetical protein GEO21_17120 [Sphingobacterium faecium]|uniref:lantibiotic dehydratase n=1 Tax=Sphingobacterium faecium TaxID=34087 RepID=UPI0012920E2D|nr:lantibiotic dehydratase [Sphingobacterium faecium]MQP29216.1 hypothetical protein [Sphingobacterium faecium]